MGIEGKPRDDRGRAGAGLLGEEESSVVGSSGGASPRSLINFSFSHDVSGIGRDGAWNDEDV